LPSWCDELATRQMLWKEYGIAWPDMTPSDFMRAVRFSNAQAKRLAYKMENR
jgi:hypothetical protein